MKRLSNIYSFISANFVFLLLLASSATLLIMFLNLSGTVQNLSKSLIKDRLNLTEQELNNIFKPLNNILKISGEWGEKGVFPDIHDQEQLNKLFIPIIKSAAANSSVLIANDQGDEYLLLNMDSLWMNRITYKSSSKENPTIYFRKENELGDIVLIKEEKQEAAYDPLSRPWYITAMSNNKTNEINWTNPYFFFTTKESGITASLKWKDPYSGHYMVIAMDILLSDLSEFTTNIDITTNGKVFIASEENEIIGLPKDPRFFDRESRNKYSLKKLKDLDIPLLNQAMIIFYQDREIRQFKFEFDNLTWWAGIETYKLSPNKNLYIGAVVPETDFAQEIKATRLLIYGGLIMLMLFFVIILYSFDRLKKAKRTIVIERDKNEKLLLNTLPIKVVKDLKESGISVPEKFNAVTVFFSDIVGFTESSGKLDPQLLIEELNEMYTAFDDIITDHESERIKTIGDAYMAVCGMPDKNDRHAEMMLKAAAEIIRYMDKRNSRAEIKWQLRIGMHSGKVVGGIVGVKKYIYDVFGDTINTASRMEHYSEPGRINLSEETYQLVKNGEFLKTDHFVFAKREPIFIKGKGETVMYFATPPTKNSSKDF